MSSAFDFGDEAREHLSMILDDSLDRWGLKAIITHALAFDNEYFEIREAEPIYPDQLDNEPAETTETPILSDPPMSDPIETKVLLGQPVKGILLDPNYISYADKLQVQYKITSKEELKLEDRVDVTMNDGKRLRLRIVEPPETYHAHSTIYYTAIVMVM